VRETGATINSRGSFSDIACLYDLGCKGFNWGVGYRDYHGPRSHVFLNDMFEMVTYYLKFHEKHKDTLLPHVKEKPKTHNGYGYQVKDKRADRDDPPAGNHESKMLSLFEGSTDVAIEDCWTRWDREDREYWEKKQQEYAGFPGTCPGCENELVYGLCRACKYDYLLDKPVHDDDFHKYPDHEDRSPVNEVVV